MKITLPTIPDCLTAADPDNLDVEGVPVWAKNAAGLNYYVARVHYMGTADPAPALRVGEAFAAVPDLLNALSFALKYAAMQGEQGRELPAQLVNAMRQALEKAGATVSFTDK